MSHFKPRKKIPKAPPGASHTPASIKAITPGAQTPLMGTTPARALTPLPVNRKPRIGFLNWGRTQGIEKSYCAGLYNPIAERSRRGEIELLLFEPVAKMDYRPYPPLEQVTAAKLDAAISNGIWNLDFLSEIAKLKIPVVSCDHDANGMPFDSVIFDGIAGGEIISKELIARGHTDVLFITRQRRDSGAVKGADPLIEDPTYIERRTGVQRGLLGSQVEFWPVISCLPRQKQAETLALIVTSLKRIVADMGHWPTAIVTPDLGVSILVKAELERLGLRIPEHLSLITFHSKSNLGNQHGYARVEYCFEEMGRRAWTMLTERMAGKAGPPRWEKLPPVLVPDASLGPRRAEP